jgi:uncharacterized membrane protein
MKYPEEIITERFNKGEITEKEAIEQLELL